MTYGTVYPWAAIEIPRGLGTHSVAEDSAHVRALAQLADHATHRRARQALLVRSVRQERSPRADAAHACCEQAGPCALWRCVRASGERGVGKMRTQARGGGLTRYGGRSRRCGRL